MANGLKSRFILNDNVSKTLDKITSRFSKTKKEANQTATAATRAQRKLQMQGTSGLINKVKQTMSGLKKATEQTGDAAKRTGDVFKGAFLANLATGALSKVQDIATSAFDSMFDQAKFKKVFQLLKGSTEEGTALFDKMMSTAANSSFDANSLLVNTQAFLPIASGDGQLDQMHNLAQRLSAFDTTGQGLEGAGFSIKEAATGDFQSLIERFNISRSAINNSGIRDLASAGDIDGVLGKLDELLNSFGMTTEAMAESMNNPRDQFIRFTNNIKSSFGNAMSHMLEQLNPFITRLNDWLASENGQQAIQNIANVFVGFVSIVTGVVDGFIYVWERWGSIITGVAVVIGVIVTAMLIYKAVMFTINAIMGIAGTLMAIYNTAVWLATGAQTAFNAAVMANPIGLLVGAIVLVVVALAAGVAALFYFSDAMGTVVGSAFWLWENILNIFKWIGNLGIIAGQHIVNAFQIAVNSVGNFFIWLWNGIVDKFITPFMSGIGLVGDGIANAFVGGANMAIRAINGIINLLNKIPGVNLGDGFEEMEMPGLKNTAAMYEKAQNLKADYLEAPEMVDWSQNQFEYGDAGAAYDNGFNIGKDFAENTKNGIKDLVDNLTGKNRDGTEEDPMVTNIAGGTIDKIEEEVKIGDEIIAVLEDFARAQFQQNFVQMSPSITVENLNNQTDTDPQQIMKELSDGINSEISRKASGMGVSWT